MEMIYVGENVENQLTNGKSYDIKFNHSKSKFETDSDDLEEYHWFYVEFVLENFIHPSHYKPESKQETQDLFQIGDVVYHWKYGKGEVDNVNYNDVYPVSVRFDGKIDELSFTKDGRYDTNEEPSLSFTPYNFKDGGFCQERPKPEPKVGDWGWFWDEGDASAVFGLLSDIAIRYYCEGYNAGFKYFSHEAPPHIAKHLKKSPNENQ
jgi:hypothetical protein